MRRRNMKKQTAAAVLCAVLLSQTATVFAEVPDFTGTVNAYKQDQKTPRYFQVEDSEGKAVQAVARTDTLYVTEKTLPIRAIPDEKGEMLRRVLLGTKLSRVAVCDNGWSKVLFQKGEEHVTGYVPNEALSDQIQMKKFTDQVVMAKDADILDYPGRKDGVVIGEVLKLDQVKRTGTINNIWSRILFRDENGKKTVGYIPTTSIQGEEETQVVLADTIDEEKEAGTIHKSTGEGVFAEAVDGVGAAGTKVNGDGVQEGSPIAVSSDAVLKPMGTFRITHYCPCSICCGPWANGITSTGVTATTNRTIAVDPTQIPYGTKVVINGQVYVAEDCGGAIKENCIDIYVGSHAEGESKGVYYTDVYVIQE